MLLLLRFLIPITSLLIHLILCHDSARTKYIAKYNPEVVTYKESHIHRQYPNHKIEVAISFGTDEEMIRVMETAIVDFYPATGINNISGNVVQHISDTMEHYYGGLWTVSLFDTAYTFAYTAQKRSPAFAVFDVNENGISIAKDGY